MMKQGDMIGHLEALSNSLPSLVRGHFVFGPDCRIVYCNEAFAHILGESQGALAGAQAPALPMAADDEAALASAIAKGEGFAAELQTERRSGEAFWCEISVVAMCDEAGQAEYFVGAIRDVTERREAHARLRKIEEDYFFIVENVSAGIVVHGPKTAILYTNPAARSLLGVEEPSLEGVDSADARWAVVDEDDMLLPVAQHPVSRAIAAREQIRQVVGNRRESDSRLIWLDCTATPVLDAAGEIEKVIVSFTDITSLKQAERRASMDRDRYRSTLALLEDSENRFKIAANTVSDVVWERNLVTGEYWITRDWPSKLGLQLARRSEHDGFDLNGIVEAEKVRQAFEAALASDRADWSIEYEMSDDLGQVISVALNATIFRDDAGKAQRIVGSLRNISAEKRQREGFTRARALEAVGQLTGGVAHDFNNLLMVIMGNAELLAMSQLSDEDRAAVELIDEATKSAARLTKRLLSFSGQRELGPKRIALPELLEKAVDLVLSGFTEAYAIKLDVPEDIGVITADPFELEQAIMNLCLNARDAMDQGGAITIACENRKLDADISPQLDETVSGDFVAISITDSGRGIPKAERAKVLEPFFTTKEIGKGTGLGLSTVYGFVKQSGGQMTIYSEEGLGTSVTMYFPRTPGEGTDAQGEETPEPQLCCCSDGLRILIVEDQPDVRAQAERALQRLGFETQTAQDARAALAILSRGEPFDLVFTDVIMPGGINGQQLADAIRKTHPDMKILFTSGYPASAFDQLGIEEMREMHIIRKPYRMTELETALAKALEQPRKIRKG